jgi:hypothetical protein
MRYPYDREPLFGHVNTFDKGLPVVAPIQMASSAIQSFTDLTLFHFCPILTELG